MSNTENSKKTLNFNVLTFLDILKKYLYGRLFGFCKLYFSFCMHEL